MSDVEMINLRNNDGDFHKVPKGQRDMHTLGFSCRCEPIFNRGYNSIVHKILPCALNELLKDPETGFGDDDEVVPEKEYYDDLLVKTPHLFISNFSTETMQPTANDIQEGGNHYKEMDIEPWDVIDTWPLEQRIGAYRAGVLKYTMRLGKKDDRGKEAKKARHYAEKLAEVLEEASEQLLKQSPEVKGS